MKYIAQIFYNSILVFVIVLLVSCTERHDRPPMYGECVIVTETAGYESAPSQGDEIRFDDIQVLVFRKGILADVFTAFRNDDGNYYLRLPDMTGNMYVLANAENLIDIGSLAGTNLKEEEWLQTVVHNISGTNPQMYYTGTVCLEENNDNNHHIPVIMTRGLARFDLKVHSVDMLYVDRVTFKGVKKDSYLFGNDNVYTPAGSLSGDISVDLDIPVSQEMASVAYLCEQANPELYVEVRITDKDRTYTKEARLPDIIKRNTIYSVVVNKDVSSSEIIVDVLEWDQDDSNETVPDFGSEIKVDLAASELPEGVEISQDRRIVVLPYTDVEGIIALECNEELEYIHNPDNGISVVPIYETDGVTGTNRFRIYKEWWRLGVPGKDIALQFKRKGLEYTYPDDRIDMVLTANPTKIDGLLDFSSGYDFDFGRYIDNELGCLHMPSWKDVSVEFADGEDNWIKLDKSGDGSGKVRIIAGWRPNDITANGRVQRARIVISNEADGSQEEVYEISRRNWGMPVTYLNGIWWCKYNAMGKSYDFNDQILSSEDPAAISGKTVFEYLETCSPEEYFNLWKWGYQGDSGVGLEVKDIDGKAKLDGFNPDINVHINTLDPEMLAPDGYQVPSFEDFGRIFETTGDYIWIMWNGSHNSPWNGGTNIQRRNKRRNDVSVGSIQMQDLFFMAMYKNGDTENEPVVWYGAGSQWDDNGVKHAHYNSILFTAYSPQKKGWFFTGPMNAYYISANGAGNKDTRILRFKKTDVEYIY